MKKSKNLYQDSIDFIKTRQKNLLLILLVPMFLVLFSYLIELGLGFIPNSEALFISLIFIVGVTLLFFVRVVHFILSYASTFAVINFIDTQHKDKNINVADSYKIGWQKFAIGVLLQFIQTMIIVLGLFLFIFPGIYLILVLNFTLYVYMVRNKGIKDSLAYSYYLIHNRAFELLKKLLYGFLQVLLPTLGIIAGIAVTSMAVISYSKVSDIGFIILGLFGAIGFVYFLIIAIQKILALQDYNYALFIEFEKTKEDPSDNALAKYRKKLRKLLITIVSAILAIAVLLLILLMI